MESLKNSSLFFEDEFAYANGNGAVCRFNMFQDKNYFNVEEVMPIVVAPVGQNLKIIKILTDELTRKDLESLGISIESEIKVMTNEGGNLVCMVNGSRIALDKSVAVKIFVA